MTKPKEGDLRITTAALADDGANLIVTLHVQNDSDQTLHVNSRVRALRYDDATRTLNVILSDAGLGEPLPSSWRVMPKLVAVDPHSTAEIVVKLSRFITKLEAGPGPGPEVVQVPAHEAEVVNVVAAWSDRPFYVDTRKKQKSMRKQLTDWQRGEAHATGRKVEKKETT